MKYHFLDIRDALGSNSQHYKRKKRKHYPRIHEHLGVQICGSNHFCFSNYISDFMKSLYEKCDYF